MIFIRQKKKLAKHGYVNLIALLYKLLWRRIGEVFGYCDSTVG